MRHKSMLLMSVAILMWGTSIPPTKWAMEGFHPFTLTFLRLLLAGLIFLLFVSKQFKRSGATIKIPWLRMWMLSFTGVAGYFTASQAGISLTSGLNASILGASLPLFVVVMAVFHLKEKINVTQIVGLLMGIIGVLMISIQTSSGGNNSIIGDLLILTGSFVWSIYIIQMKKPQGEVHLPSEAFTALTLVLGAILVFPLLAVEIYLYGWPMWKLDSLASLVYLTIFPTIGAYWLWNKGLQYVSATSTSVYLNILPLVSFTFSALILGELITWRTILGGCLVLSGVYLSEKKVTSISLSYHKDN